MQIKSKELPWIPAVWTKYPPSRGKKPRTKPAPVSTIIIQIPKTAHQKREAQRRLKEGQLPQLPDFIQVRRKEPKTSFQEKVKNKRAAARDLQKNIVLNLEVKKFAKNIVEFDKKILDQKKKLRDVWVPASTH